MPHPSWITHSVTFFIGAAVTVAADIALRLHSSQLDRHQYDKDKDEKNANNHQGISAIERMLPSLPTRIYQPNENLTIVFDTRSKNPLFVMERLTSTNDKLRHQNTTLLTNNLNCTFEKTNENDDDISDHGVGVSRKNKRFHEEQTLLPYHRSRNQYYRNSGFDRGHLAPAADYALDDKEMNDTFVLTNASPQLPRFNRSLWLRLEEFVRKVASEQMKSTTSSLSSNHNCVTETWVVTGPLWLPAVVTRQDDSGSEHSIFHYSYKGIGKPPSLIAVPTHFYKVLVVVERPSTISPKNDASVKTRVIGTTLSTCIERGDENAEIILKKFAAFVVPNAGVGIDRSFRLIDHVVRLSDLEAVTGLEFFPFLFGSHHRPVVDMNNNDAIPLEKEIADALTDDVRSNRYANVDKGKENKLKRNETCNVLIPMSAPNEEEYSKGRRKRMQQILRENSLIPFQHLCKENELCYKILKA